MRIKVACHLPSLCDVAVSGGPDSMALLDFLNRSRRVRRIIHVNHGTPMAPTYETLVRAYADGINIPVHVTTLSNVAATEAGWSGARRAIYQSNDLPVAVGHTFDDALEWWVYTGLRGSPKAMPIVNGQVFRPFVCARKTQTVGWCEGHGVPYAVDPTNIGDGNMRAKLRMFMPNLEDAVPAMSAALRKALQGGIR